MKKLIFIALSLLLPQLAVFAQRPTVTGISPVTATVNEAVIITGTNFPAATDLLVYFGAAKASVVEANSTMIKALVPAGATYEPITVTNLVSGLSAKSLSPFQLSFGGGTFDPALIAAETGFSAGTTDMGAMYELCTCDFNNDGKVDAITTNYSRTSISAFRNFSTLGTINFAKTDVIINASSRNVVCGDLDGDGRPDLVVSGAGNSVDRIYVLRNLSATGGALTFSAPTVIPIGNSGAARLALHDLNTDGRPEIIMTNRSLNIVSIFKNASSPGYIQFDAQPQNISITGPPNTYGLSVQDLDGDGLPDLAVSPLQGSNVYLLRNTSSGNTISFNSDYSITTDPGLANITAADLNNDGKPDLAATLFYDKGVIIWLNNSSSGNLQFASEYIIITSGSAPWGITAGDINGDGKTDLLVDYVGNPDDANFNVALINQTTSALQLQEHQVNTRQNGRYIKLADVNGDAKPDILYTGVAGNQQKGVAGNQLEVMRNKHCVVPRLSHTGTVTLCSGQSMLLATTKALGVTYKWTRNGVALSTTEPFITVTDAGIYGVTITSTLDGCALTSETVQFISGTGGGGSSAVAIDPIPAVCVGGTVELKATAINGATYVWNGPNGFTATTTTPSYSLSNVQPAAAGSYSVVIRSGECQFTTTAQTLSVNQNPQPQITSSATAFCAGTTVSLQAPAGFTSYQWKLNGANYTGPGATTASITTGTAGNYSVVVSNATGCSGESGMLAIAQTQAPVAAFNAPATACLQQPVALQNTSTYAAGSTPTFLWTFGDGQTSTEANPSHTYTNTGTYTVNLTVKYGSQSCSSNTSKTISVVVSPVVQLVAEGGTTTFCPGDSVLLSLEGDVQNVLWSTGETTPAIYARDSGIVSAQVVTSAGCTLDKAITLTHLEQPQLTLSASSTSLAVGEIATLTIGGALQYEWEQADGLDDLYSSSVSVKPLKTTTYTVRGWGENGCAAQASVTIEVDNTLRINPPKIFVPQVDGTWTISNIESYPDLHLSLVNSLGRTILEAAPYNNSWDGSDSGRPLEAGVYYYIFKDASGKVLKTGSITLLR
ncbi:FG-GAP-like repeat-containing protein [Cesiribacter sp. SM1]|uniref:FG-GAP-like repeat-containing protein n=1 Tax=Cesiribacter sp. SM1 TaxID=2861196 RepID=UPI0027151BE9|nr:FG-GAP-like repeat-containing protein [Cesiribacter sp. SM1]